MIKLMEISNCYQCGSCGTINCRDHFCNKSDRRKFEGNIFKEIPQWCPLDDQPSNTQMHVDTKAECIKCNGWKGLDGVNYCGGCGRPLSQ